MVMEMIVHESPPPQSPSKPPNVFALLEVYLKASADVCGERDRLKSELDMTKEERNILASRLQKSAASLLQTMENLTQAQRRITRLQKVVEVEASLRAELENSRHEHSKLVRENAELNERCSSLEMDAKTLQQKLAENTGRTRALEEKAARFARAQRYSAKK
jgi:chromosome segregation ATPase